MLIKKFISILKKAETYTNRVTASLENKLWLHRLNTFMFNTKSLPSICPKLSTFRLFIVATITALISSAYGYSIFSKPGWAFQEGKPMTIISFFLLLAVGYILNQVWNINKLSSEPLAEDSSTAWWLLSWGFYIAAWDEMLRLHKTLDRQLHHLFRAKPNHITDHLDDLFVALYGVAGIFILWTYRQEILKFWKVWPYFCFAAFLGIISLIIDVLCADKPFLSLFFKSTEEMAKAIMILDITEECFKIYAEIFFVGLVIAVYKISLGYKVKKSTT